MTAFSYVITLESFVYALALTHLLSRAGGLLLARDRVRFSGLQLLMMINAVLAVFVDWLSAWSARDATQWDFVVIAIWFLYAIANYFVCAAAAPEAVPGELIDLEAFYWRNYKIFYFIYMALVSLGIAGSVAFLNTRNPGFFWTNVYTGLPFLVPAALAILVKARWAQWISGVALALTTIAWGFLFESALR